MYEINQDKSVENIAGEGGEDGPDLGEGGFIWND